MVGPACRPGPPVAHQQTVNETIRLTSYMEEHDSKRTPDYFADACDLPETQLSSPEELAWRLFVAINCVRDDQLTWEIWKTQACIDNPSDCSTPRLHDSELAKARTKPIPDDSQDGGDISNNKASCISKGHGHTKRTGPCQPMLTHQTCQVQDSLKYFIPKNLSHEPIFCEEVTVNPAEYAYASKLGLLSGQGQGEFLKAGGTVDFPPGAVEVKADWVPASSFKDVTFDCDKGSDLVYLERIQNECYALAGLHVNSKLFPNWLWATFEPQYKVTNPNRCNPKLYNACLDPWGSEPELSTGQDTQPTAELSALFAAAGARLDRAFHNYRLVGVQTEFSEPVHSQGVLGSSFVEFNANVPARQASCITCHSYSQYSLKEMHRNRDGSPFQGYPMVGPPLPPPASGEWQRLDFSWFLGLGVPAK